MSRLSECPDSLRSIPWQSVQIKLGRIQLTDEERFSLLRDFESDRLEMKVLGEDHDVYLVDLIQNGKSLTEHMLELRQKKTPAPVVTEEVSRRFPVPSNGFSLVSGSPREGIFRTTSSSERANHQYHYNSNSGRQNRKSSENIQRMYVFHPSPVQSIEFDSLNNTQSICSCPSSQITYTTGTSRQRTHPQSALSETHVSSDSCCVNCFTDLE